MGSRKTEVGELRLLDLDAEVDAARIKRMSVKVDGKTYELRSPDDMDMAARERLRVLFLKQQTTALQPDAVNEGDPGLTETERAAIMDDIEQRICRLALLDAPADLVIADRVLRGRLVEVFTNGLGAIVLVPIVEQINREIQERNRQEAVKRLREIRSTSTDSGETKPSDSAGTAKPPTTSSSATAAD